MNNLSATFSRSFVITSALGSPQIRNLSEPSGFHDPYAQFDQINDPFAKTEGADQNATTYLDYPLEGSENIDPRLILQEYPDPDIEQQNSRGPYYRSTIPEIQQQPVQLPNATTSAFEDFPLLAENMPWVDFESLWAQDDLASQNLASQTGGPESSAPQPSQRKTKSHVLQPYQQTRFGELSKFKPDDVYDALPRAPPGFDKFLYTKYGEFDPDIIFTTEDIERYLAHHLLNARRSSNSGVTLWIQRNPADSRLRYHNQVSARCRFQDCPAVNRLVSQGFYRVALEEHGAKGENYDPIGSNAGYFHLYCFEKFLDFPRICKEYNVKVDTRTLKKEPSSKNRMQLGFQLEISAAQRFLKSCKNGIRPADYPDHTLSNRPYENTLSHILATEMYQHRGRAAVNQLSRRNAGDIASSWTTHLGNLELQAQSRALTRTREGQIKKTLEEKASGPKPQRVLNEPVEKRQETMKLLTSSRSSSSTRSQESSNEVALPQAEKPRGGPPDQPKPTSKNSSQTTTAPSKSSSRSRSKLAASRSKRSSESKSRSPSSILGKRLRSRARPVSYVEPDTDADMDDEEESSRVKPVSYVEPESKSRSPSPVPGKRLRSRTKRVSYVEPDTDADVDDEKESPVQTSGRRTSKRRRVRPNYAESDSDLPMGDTIVVRW